MKRKILSSVSLLLIVGAFSGCSTVKSDTDQTESIDGRSATKTDLTKAVELLIRDNGDLRKEIQGLQAESQANRTMLNNISQLQAVESKPSIEIQPLKQLAPKTEQAVIQSKETASTAKTECSIGTLKAKSKTNIRADASETSKVIRILKKDETVKFDCLENGWYKLHPNGYVNKDYVKVQ
jgi:hypothetical protein